MILKLHIISDIHREKTTYKEFVLPKTDADAIVMAGDIDNGFKKNSEYLKRIAQEHQKKVFYVLGNNCMYGRKIKEEREKWYGADLDGVVYLDEGIVESFMDYNFVGGTLWPLHQGLSLEEIIQSDDKRLNGKKDKRIFKENGNIMTTFDHIKETLKELKWMESVFRQGKKNIAITHYGPTWESQRVIYPGDKWEGAHACDVEELIAKYDIDLWIHGHIHEEFKQIIGETVVYANPVPPSEMSEKRLNRVIEL